MTKLYYVKCDNFICDVTNDFGKANLLVKEYQADDPSGKYKVQYNPGDLVIRVTPFNKTRMKEFLNKEYN